MIKNKQIYNIENICLVYYVRGILQKFAGLTTSTRFDTWVRVDSIIHKPQGKVMRTCVIILNTRAHLSRQIVDLTWTSDTNWEVMSWLLVGHIKKEEEGKKHKPIHFSQ